MKKILVFAIVAMSALFADNTTDIQELQRRVELIERYPTPPVMCGKNGYGPFVTGEALYWKMTQEGLDYAVSADYNVQLEAQTATIVFGDIDIPNGRVHKPNFEHDWGFRVGLGYNIPRDRWDIYSYWTRFHHSYSDSVSVEGNVNPNNIIGLLTGESQGSFISTFWVAKLFSTPNLMNSAKANFSLELDLIDLELGRNFYIGEFLTMRPFVGLKNGWIDQSYHLTFESFDFFNVVPDPDVLGRRINVRMKNDFWGIGGKAGLNTQWILGGGFSIYGKGSLSLLKGRFRVRYRLHDERPIQTIDVITGLSTLTNILVQEIINPYDGNFEMKKTIHTTLPIVDLALGLRYDKSFSECRYCLSIWAGYEQNIFFNLKPLYEPTV